MDEHFISRRLLFQSIFIMMQEALSYTCGKYLLSCNILGLQCLSLNHCCNALYPCFVASGDHLSQLVLSARSGTQVVANWLLSVAPGSPRIVQQNMLIWWGDLSNTQRSHYSSCRILLLNRLILSELVGAS